jgi:hypothetical protein
MPLPRLCLGVRLALQQFKVSAVRFLAANKNDKIFPRALPQDTSHSTFHSVMGLSVIQLFWYVLLFFSSLGISSDR